MTQINNQMNYIVRVLFPIKLLSSFLITSLALFSETVHSESYALSGSRPNIIFFLADDQSKADHLTYGNSKAPTQVTHEFSIIFV